MESISYGWMVISENHPNSKNAMIFNYTFSLLRKDAITKFTKGSGTDWKYWYRKYNYRCVRTKCILSYK